MTPSKRKIILLTILLLLVLCTVLLFACKEDDFYKKYAASDSGATQNASLTEETPSVEEPAPEADGASSLEKESDESGSDLEKEMEKSEIQKETDGVTEPNEDSATLKEEGSVTQRENDTQEEVEGTNEGSEKESSDHSEKSEQNGSLSDEEQGEDQNGKTQSDPDQTSGGQTSEEKNDEGSSLFDKEEPDYAVIFDLSVSWGDFYLYKSFDAPSDNALAVFVGREMIGTVTVTAAGDVTFDCGFTESECELWGKWDQKGKITTYVFFETLVAFKEIEFSSEAVQLDLSASELDTLRAVVSTEEPEPGEEQEDKDSQQKGGGQEEPQGDPTPQENNLSDEGKEGSGEQEVPQQQGEDSTDGSQGGGSTQNEQPNEEQPPEQNENGTEQSDEEQGQAGNAEQNSEENETPVVGHGTVADLSALEESKAYSLLEGLYGVAEEILVNYMDEEGEDYSFTLKEMTSEDLLTLRDLLSPYDTYPSDGKGELYKKQCVLGGQSFIFSVTVTEEQGGYCAAFKVVGVSLAE